ncbi:MAG: tRNA pseudouridine(55) synthase TruB [Saprospiraceae bacterium]|nr:tRNA pseudouridine(55) synthase TruB [Saprospiraceae bacterium]
MTILHPNQPFPDPFPKGAVLLVDKPLGWTSFDVVNKVRYHLSKRLGVKRVKIGHAGTLDPLATGLLILCVGDYTKRIEEFQDMPKVYTGVFTFGATTPSYDREKAVDAEFETSHLTNEALQAALPAFIGDIAQIPPVFSAVKVEGKRLYKNARSGAEVDIQPRTVQISHLTLGPLFPVPEQVSESENINAKGVPIMLFPDYPGGVQAEFEVHCGKGTYIRSLAYDLGRALGTGAYLSSLRRTETGGFSVAGAWALDALVDWARG